MPDKKIRRKKCSGNCSCIVIVFKSKMLSIYFVAATYFHFNATTQTQRRKKNKKKKWYTKIAFRHFTWLDIWALEHTPLSMFLEEEKKRLTVFNSFLNITTNKMKQDMKKVESRNIITYSYQTIVTWLKFTFYFSVFRISMSFRFIWVSGYSRLFHSASQSIGGIKTNI